MEQQTGRLINSFDFCQPISDVYYAQSTNESAHILLNLLSFLSIFPSYGKTLTLKVSETLKVSGTLEVCMSSELSNSMSDSQSVRFSLSQSLSILPIHMNVGSASSYHKILRFDCLLSCPS